MPSSFRDDVTGALPLPDPMTITALLLDRAARRGDHTALRVDDVRVTYRELVDRAGGHGRVRSHVAGSGVVTPSPR